MKEKRRWLPVAAEELRKCIFMPAFYVLLLMCIGFNVFLMVEGLANKIDDIRYDAELLNRDTDKFAELYQYDFYDELDMKNISRLAGGTTEYDGWTAFLIQKNYGRLQKRAAFMRDQEKNSLSFTGERNLHYFLFDVYFKALGIESILLLVLILVYSMHYEKMHRTENLVLTSKCGEKLFSIKMFVSGVVILTFIIVLWGISLLLYFTVVDYSSIWNSLISSNYNSFMRTINDKIRYLYPCVTWIPFTIWQYFLASLVVMMSVLVIIFFCVGEMSRWFPGTATFLVTLGIGGAVLYVLGNMIHFPNMLEFIVKCNPVHLLTKCGYWFMDYAPGDSYPMYECLTIGVWAVICFFIQTKAKR